MQNSSSGLIHFIHSYHHGATDLLDRLAEKDITDVTVDDLVSALHVTPEEVKLLQTMTAGQRHNPLWMDARQWRVTESNFGKVCKRHREPGYYPPFLLKLLLGDHSTPVSAPLQWGVANEDVAIQAYAAQVGRQVDLCGIFISYDHPFLGASPDGIVFDDGNEMSLIRGEDLKCQRTWKVVMAILEGDAAFSLPAERDIVAVAA